MNKLQADDIIADEICFNADGLIPVITQQHDSGEVLMLAWMNREALVQTLQSGQMCYWSRSRRELWRKGESSGQTQRLISLRLDCDGDTLLALVEQTGVACHTGRRSCFFRELTPDGINVISGPEIDPAILYGDKNE